jgi:hypothetical protein
MAASEADSIATLVALVGQRLDAIGKQVADLHGEVKTEYLRKDIADARYANLEAKVNDIRKDADAVVDRQRAQRNLFYSACAFPLLTGVLVLLTALALGNLG